MHINYILYCIININYITGVFLAEGFSTNLIIDIILTLFGFIPGLIYAAYIIVSTKHGFVFS